MSHNDDTHVSLDRPKVAPLEGGLPLGAIPYGPRSSWPLIVNALWEKRGTWHVLERAFKHPASAITSARKWCDLLLPDDASSYVELAYRPLPGGKVEVYLRIRQPEQEPFFSWDEDDPEEEEHEAEEGLELAPLAPMPTEEPEEPQKAPQGVTAPVRVGRDLAGRAIITESVARAIILRVRAGQTQRTVARELGISESVVSSIMRRGHPVFDHGDWSDLDAD